MNDLVYNEIVATPGYELEFAVGTTYSLDAEAFLAIALSFARLGDVTDADFQSPFRLLEGLRQANSKIAIFCNRGGLQPPVRMNPLYAMLDKSVFEVADERYLSPHDTSSDMTIKAPGKGALLKLYPILYYSNDPAEGRGTFREVS